jgi:hypothetical protein
MPKAIAMIRDIEVNAGQVNLFVDFTITDNAGKVLAFTTERDARAGVIARQQIPYTTGTITAAQVNDAIEARAIAVAAGVGQTIVAADVVMVGLIQGA